MPFPFLELHNSASAKYLTSRRVIHEMMHAVGFFHEDSRPDRDEHVDTDREKQRVNPVNMVGEYDVCSLMHYGGPQRVPKLVPKKCKSWDCSDCPDCYNCNVADVRRNVTELDVQKINLYYGCNKIGIHYTYEDEESLWGAASGLRTCHFFGLLLAYLLSLFLVLLAWE